LVGKRSVTRPDMLNTDRKQLVGLLTTDPKTVLEEGAQIVLDPTQKLPMKMVGHVTSSYWSATLGRSIALAVIEGGRAWLGARVVGPWGGGVHAARVPGAVFVDPKNKRLSA
jgi:sarcosine oxidase subunit alpha